MKINILSDELYIGSSTTSHQHSHSEKYSGIKGQEQEIWEHGYLKEYLKGQWKIVSDEGWEGEVRKVEEKPGVGGRGVSQETWEERT